VLSTAAIVVVAAAAAAAIIVKTIADTVLRFREVESGKRTAPRDRDVEVRLQRLEAAVDAVALEVERIGEHQRFASQLSGQPLPPGPTEGYSSTSGRVVTPH